MNKRIRNPQRFAKKRIAMQLLHEVADCSLKEVCYLLGYSGNSMPDIYRHINDIKEDVLYDKNLGREYKEILKQLGI